MPRPVQLTQTLQMTRADTKQWSFAVVDENKAAVSCSGATAKFTAKTLITDSDGSAIFQLTESSGISFTAGTGGTGTITVSPSNTSGLAVRAAAYELVFDFQVKVNGNTYTVAAGTLLVYSDVTQI